MGVLEDLAAALYGQQAQEAIRAENPYYQFQTAPKAVADTSLGLIGQDPTRYGAGEIAATMGLSGLLSGILGGMGGDYQDILTGRYGTALEQAIGGGAVEVPGLPGALGRQAKQQGTLFRKLEELEDRRTQRDLISKLQEKGLGKLIELGAEERFYGAGTPTVPPVSREQRNIGPVASGDEYASMLQEPDTAREVGLIADPRTRAGKRQQIAIEIEDLANKRLDSGLRDFKEALGNFNELKALWRNPSGAAGQASIAAFSNVLDPGSFVGDAEVRRPKKTVAALKRIGISYDRVMKGTDDLGPDARARLIEAAGQVINSYSSKLDFNLEREKSLVARRGGNPENVSYQFEIPEPFDIKSFVKETPRDPIFQIDGGLKKIEIINGQSYELRDDGNYHRIK